MELKGKIIHELELVTGMGKKGSWQKQEYVIETPGQYPKKVAFSVCGENIDKLNLSLGDEVTVSVELESREYNSRWFTEVRAWKCEHHKFAGPSKSTPAESRKSEHSTNNDSDLPF